ncbi:histone H1 [Lasioglossum baleicum]|uniref:histone H1 n=1 Tax=Lasioglossum baleicum TaxID=434251 RepID=UPI003FCE6A49
MEDKTSSGNVAAEAVESTASPKKATKSSKSKVQRVKASHPPTSEMVNSAIKELKDRKGSSLQAIKKYIASTYMVDGEKLAPFIKRYLKTAVTSGAVVQTKGKGASGSFKLNTGKSTTEISKTKKTRSPRKPAKTPAVEKKTVAKKASPPKKPASPKKPVEKKAAVVKKTPTKAAATKAKAASEVKSPSKAKKTAKAPAAKTKTPKPKKASAAKAVKSPAKK